MWWCIIGVVVFTVIFGMINYAVEQELNKKFREQSAKQIGELIELWCGKNKKQ